MFPTDIGSSPNASLEMEKGSQKLFSRPLNMRSFIDSRAQPIFLDSTSPAFFNQFSKMNSDLGKDVHDQSTFNSDDNKNNFFIADQRATNELVESNDSAAIPSSGRKPDEKKMKRVLANRRSARESYQRRKKMFADLESTVTSLTKDNADLVDENKRLRRQVMSLHQQLGLSFLPSNPMGGNSSSTVGSGIGANSLTSLQQLAAAQQNQQTSSSSQQNSSSTQSSNHQNQMAQQQGELDQLLELILRGRAT